MNIDPQIWSAIEKFGPAIVFAVVLGFVIVPAVLLIAVRALNQANDALKKAEKARDDFSKIASENSTERRKIQEEKDKLALMTVRQNERITNLSHLLEKVEETRREDLKTHKREIDHISRNVERIQQEHNNLKDKFKVVADDNSIKDVTINQKTELISEQLKVLKVKDQRITDLESQVEQLTGQLSNEKTRTEDFKNQLSDIQSQLEQTLLEREQLTSSIDELTDQQI